MTITVKTINILMIARPAILEFVRNLFLYEFWHIAYGSLKFVFSNLRPKLVSVGFDVYGACMYESNNFHTNFFCACAFHEAQT